MPAIATSRAGFSQGYALGENNWNIGYDENWKLLDRLVGMDFGIFSVTGRVIVLLGGAIATSSGVSTATAQTTLTCTASTLNYVERTPAGVVTQNVTGFSSTAIPLYTVACDATSATSIISFRFTNSFRGAGVMLPAASSFDIQQGSDDGEIFLLRALGGVAHGMTAVTGTDVFGRFAQCAPDVGGLKMTGLSESTRAFDIFGYCTTADTTKSAGADGTVLIDAAKKSGTSVTSMAANENLFVIRNNGAAVFIFDADGDIHATRHVNIGPLGSAHTGAVGLTISQGGEDGYPLQLASSDVVHNFTGLVATDVYGAIGKVNANDGGLFILGFTEQAMGVAIMGAVNNQDGTRSTAAVAPVVIDAASRSGSTIAAMAANQNMFVVRNNGTARFILDSDGDSHQDVGTLWTNFDIVRDVDLLNVAAAHLTAEHDPLRHSFHGWLEKDRSVLEKHHLVSFNEDGHHFINWSRMSMLLIGAVRQLGAEVQHMREQLNLPEHPSMRCLPSV